MTNAFRNNQRLFIPLILSMVFFLRKAFQYVMIGSYVPLIIVGTFLLLMFINLKNKNLLRLTIKTWALTLIFWCTIRMLITTANYFTGIFDEYHLSTQFGVGGVLLSIGMLIIGVILFRSTKTKK